MNDAKDTLAIRPEPYMLESLPAYLLRVAHANGYAGTQRVFRMDGRRKIDLSTLGPLLSSMRAAFHTSLLLESEQPSPNGARVWNLRRARYCPVCLRTGRHWNRAWDLMLVTACPEHRCQLIDQCHACTSTITWMRADLAACQCGEALNNGPGQQASPLELAISTLFSMIICGKALPEPFEKLNIEKFSLLCATIGSYAIDARRTRKPMKSLVLSDVEIARTVAETIAPFVIDWRHGFAKILSEIASIREDKKTLAGHFGPFYDALYQTLSDPAFDFVRDEFALYVKTNWKRPITRRHSRLPDGSHAHPWVSISDLHQSGVTDAVARRILKIQPEAAAVNRCTSRTKTAVLRSFALETYSIYENALSLEQAAQYLALPRRRVREMLDAGLLEELPRIFSRQRRYIKRASLEGWNTRLKPIVDELVVSTLVTLKSQLRSRIASEREWICLMRSIQTGNITLWRAIDDHRLGASMVELANVINSRVSAITDSSIVGTMKSTAAAAESLTIPAAAEILSVKQEVCYHLVNSGLLPTTSIIVFGRAARVVAQDAIDTFTHEFVSLIDVAQIRGMAPRALLNLLESQGISPVTGPRIDGCRQYFLRRCDVLP